MEDHLSRASWLSLIRTPSEWQHEFGPTHSPVLVAGASPQVTGIVDAIRGLRGSPPKCVLIEGGVGSGKSIVATAFHAECLQSGVDALMVNEGSDPASLVASAASASALIVDNLDLLPGGLRRALFERRTAVPQGTVLTTSGLSALERELLSPADELHVLGGLEERPSDVLVLATLKWRDLGLTPDLPDICADEVPLAFSRGPWARGARSVRRFVEILAERLALEGYFERAPRPIGPADALGALVEVLREERPPERRDVIRIIVEGRTDAMYLEAAARLAHANWGTDLLSSCEISPPGEEREGGADRAARHLISLEAQGVIAIALFDDDELGRAAAKDARRFTSQKVHVLPAEFDPLGNDPGSSTVEIEDLLPGALLRHFYDEHPELHPEEMTTRGDRTRIVIAGPDKNVVAAWVCDRATFADLERITYALCMMRASIGLSLPGACPPLDEWLRRLSRR